MMTIALHSWLSWFILLSPPCCFSSQKTVLVQGWGKIGHELVGEIAYHRLSAKAQSAACALLGVNNTNSNSSGWSPLANVSDWADVIKYHARWSSPLHYVDVHEDAYVDHCRASPPSEAADNEECQFVYERDCQGDLCVVGAIVNYTNRLYQAVHDHHVNADDNQHAWSHTKHTSSPQVLQARNLRSNHRHHHHHHGRTLSSTSRMMNQQVDPCCNGTAKESLMFLTHFIGDVHQPLHVSRSDDRGGNSIAVRFPTSLTRTKQTNLHEVWDDDILTRLLDDQFEGDALLLHHFLQQELLPPYGLYSKDVPSWADTDCINTKTKTKGGGYNKDVGMMNVSCPSLWAQESLAYALHAAYYAGDMVATTTSTASTVMVEENDCAEEDCDVQDGDALSEGYYETRWPIVLKRLAMGGVRLAAVLEGILGGEKEEEEEMNLVRNEDGATSHAKNELLRLHGKIWHLWPW